VPRVPPPARPGAGAKAWSSSPRCSGLRHPGQVRLRIGVADDVADQQVVDPVGLSWFELRQIGVVQRFEVTEPGEGSAGIALAHITNERLGAYFLGQPLYERALQSAERRGGAENLILYAIDGSRLRLFRQEGWSIVQDGDTLAIDPRAVVSLGLPSGGVVSGEATMIGIMLVEGGVDMARPFTFVYDLGDLGVGQDRFERAETEQELSDTPDDGIELGNRQQRGGLLDE